MSAEAQPSRPWEAYSETVIDCDEAHPRPPEAFLCPGCRSELAGELRDLPELALELELARTRQTRFVAHGLHTPWEAAGADLSASEADPGVSEWLPYSPGAQRAAQRLARALSSGDTPRELGGAARELLRRLPFIVRLPSAPQLARELSSAVAEAYRVIDRPADLVYLGPCPRCRRDLSGERGQDRVSCGCGYSSTMQDHQLAALTAGENALLTVGELVGAITQAGETVSRDQINGWIRRDGLPREAAVRARWRGGQLVHRKVYVYRLGDVRELARRAEAKRS